jgi:hypothetical protein
MIAYELDPAHCHLGGGRVVVPWPGLHKGQHITVEIAGKVHPATVTTIRTRYAIAHLTPAPAPALGGAA